jgi:exodeoxyribonuclease-5
MIEWGTQQKAALDDIRRWLKDPYRQVYTLFGFAGTGKTTLAKAIAELSGNNVLFGAFTGKAAVVMQKNGCIGAQTLHSMIYTVIQDDEDGTVKFIVNSDSDVRTASLVIVDEVSMVDNELGRDLLSFGRKVLVLGDPGQLPPVRGTGFFIDVEPDMMLTDIRRQALDNPIIRLSMQARERQPIQRGEYGDILVLSAADINADDVMGADQVLVGKNATRRSYNKRMRQLYGRKSEYPEPGERMICLRNNRNKGLLNGSLWEWQKGELKKTHYAFENGYVEGSVRSLDLEISDPVDVRIPTEFFNGNPTDIPWAFRKLADEFDYGYAITAHKSQGSQFDSVFIFDESAVFREDAHRWLYTAITRAAERVTIVQHR